MGLKGDGSRLKCYMLLNDDEFEPFSIVPGFNPVGRFFAQLDDVLMLNRVELGDCVFIWEFF